MPTKNIVPRSNKEGQLGTNAKKWDKVIAHSGSFETISGSITPQVDDAFDLGASGKEWKDLYIDGTANIDSLAMGTTITSIVDEDNMASDSATALATQQSIKAYVDSQVTAADLDATTDSGTIDIDLDSETLTIAGGEGIDTSATGTTITIAGEEASTSNKGVASFSSDNFAVSSGVVTIKDSGVILGTETTGNYVSTAVAGNGIDVSGATGDVTISIGSGEVTSTMLATAVAGDGLAGGGGSALSVNVDDSSIEINSDTLRVKASGITNAMLNGSIADSKLSTISTANKVSIDALDIDGGTAIGEAVADADLFITDNGAGGTNRKVTASALKTYMAGQSGGSTLGNIQVGITNANELDTSSGNLTIDSAGGTITLDDNVSISGDLSVAGTTTTVNSTEVSIADRILTLNAGSAAGDGGIYVNDADSAETGSLLWDVSTDRWIGGLKDSEVTIPTISSTDTLTNKSINASNNTLTNIPNSALTNTSVNFGGVTVALGGSDTTPAFDLADATGYLTSNLSGTITNAQLAGSIANSKLANDSVTITAGDGLKTGGEVDLGSSVTLDIDVSDFAGTGLSGDGSENLNIDAAQTGITSVVNSSLEIGRDADNRIKFGTDNQIIFEVDGGDNVIMKSSGEIEATSLDISGDVDVDGTLEADAITVGGTALSSVIAGTTVSNATTAAVATTVTITDNESTNEDNAIVFTAGGDVDGGNIGLESDGTLTYNPSTGTVTATGFSGNLTGTLQTAAQTNITSVGTLTALTVDNVSINGQTIGYQDGLADKLDLLTLSPTTLTVDGELDATSLDISGDADIDGTLEADAITIGGVTLAETISDTVGAMVGSNTETGITVTYDDSDNTLDFVIGSGVITNDMLAGSIANGKLSNSAVTVTAGDGLGGGGSVSLGSSVSLNVEVDDSSIEINSDSLRVKAGGITNAMLGGSIANSKLANDSVSFGGVSVDLGSSNATPAFDLSSATSYPGDSSLVTTGNLNSGAITSGFGDIDIGGGAAATDGNTLTAFSASIAYITASKIQASIGVFDADTLQVGNQSMDQTLLANLQNTSGTNTGDQLVYKNVASDSGTAVADTTTDTLTIAGGEGIDTSASGDTITIAGEDASTSNKGVASFSSDNFSVSSGAVTIKDGGVANAELANSAVTITAGDGLKTGGSVSLGSSVTLNIDVSDFAGSGLEDDSSENLQIAAGGVTNTMLAGSIANAKLSNSSITVSDGSTTTDVSLGGTITFAAGEGMDVGESSGTITFSGEEASTSNKGVASFSSDNFAVSSGVVTIKNGGVILGTETTGNYVSTAVAGNGIDVSGATGDVTISIGSGEVTNTMLAGSIANSKLSNDSITLSQGAGMAAMGEVDLGASVTVGVDGVLEDLDTLGAASSDGQVIVATGAGAFQYESGATLRTTIGVGTGDTPIFAGVEGGNINVGITNDNEIDTDSGNLTIDSAGGTITLDDNVVISGNLTVSGTETKVNSTTLEVGDNIVELNAGTNDGGLYVKETSGGAATGSLLYDVSANRWIAGTKGSEVTLPTISSTDTLTNKTINASNNTLSNIGNSSLSNSSVNFGGVSVSLGGSDTTPAFDLSDATGLPTSALTGTITNSQLAGSIANAKLANSSISIGGISFSLGDTDATPAFDLSDATGYATSNLSGTITNSQLAGSIANAKLANDSVNFGGVTVALGGSDTTPAFDLSDATSLPTTALTGTITNAQLAGSIAASKLAGSIGNSKLSNSAITIDGTSVSLGGSITTNNTVDMGDGFVIEDGDGTEVTITENKEVKFVEGTGIDINWTDTSNGSDGDPYDLTITNTAPMTGDTFDEDGTFASLRAQGTTKGDVGLGLVENTALSTYTGNGGALDNQYIANGANYVTAGVTLTTAAQPNITSVGTLTSLTVDDITLNGSTISDGGDLTMDIGGDLVIDVDGTDIILKDGGVAFGRFKRDTSDFIIKSETSNEDMIFRGNDAGVSIDALTLDMSEAGAATFHGGIANAGTISDGTWSGTAIAVAKGGTGATSAADARSNLGITYANIGTVDISSNTNLSAGTNITLSGDTLNVDDAFLINDGDDTTTGTITAGGFTTAGSLTLGGHAVNDIDIGGEFNDVDDHLMTSAAINDRITSFGYTTNTGTMTSATISVGTGLDGGGTISGAGGSFTQISLDLSELTDMTADVVGSQDELILLDNGAERRKLINEIKLSQFNNDSGFLTTVDISSDTNLSAGTNITLSGDTLNVDDAFLKNDADDTTSGTLTAANFVTSGKIGSSTNDEFFDFGTDAMIKVEIDDVEDFRFADGGTFHARADVIAYSSTPSDERLKDNVVTIDSGLSLVNQLRGVTFDWNQGSKQGTRDIGVIAQEVEKVLPELVKENKLPLITDSDETYKTVDYEKLTAVLIEAVKDLSKEIDDIKKKCDCLKD